MKISTCIITYNHEPFLRKCLDGAISQKLNCEYEIIIGEDFSTDKTLDICKEYQLKYPNIIRLLPSNKNYGMMGNWLRTISECKGKYIAICEGDDYWTDSMKLQKQVDYLNTNKEYSFVFTPALTVKSSIKKLRNRYDKFDSNNFNLESVLKLGGGFYPTLTAFFDSEILKTENNFLKLHSTADYPLAILAALRGKIGYIDDVTGVYRVQNNSVSNKLYDNCHQCSNAAKSKFIKNISFFEFLFSEIEVNSELKRELISKESYVLLSKYLDCGNYSSALSALFSSKLLFKHLKRIITKFIYVLTFRMKSIKIKQL